MTRRRINEAMASRILTGTHLLPDSKHKHKQLPYAATEKSSAAFSFDRRIKLRRFMTSLSITSRYQYSMNVARPQMITATERKPQSLVEASGRPAKPNRRIPYW